MEVYALVGASGTGKSHRATLVALEVGAELVIDDGLLIRDGKILGGRSAKGERSKLGAVRRAIFTDAAQAAEVRRKLLEAEGAKILILGTSVEMVQRISRVLELPQPQRYIQIEDVASPAEIIRARRSRREEGKHVIPAPTLEVKRTFSGLHLLDPLRFILRKKDLPRDVVVEKAVVRPTWSSLGKFFIADRVVCSIAVHCIRKTPGLGRIGKVSVEAWPEGLIIHLDVGLCYGFPFPQVLAEVQERVKGAVEKLTSLNVVAVNLTARALELK